MLLVYHVIFSAFMTLIQGMLFYKINFTKQEKTTLKIIPSYRITPTTSQLSIQKETLRKLDENKFYQGRTNHTTPTKEDIALSTNRQTMTSIRRPQKNKTVPIQVIYDSEQQLSQETKETQRNNKKPQTYIGKPIKLSLFSRMPKHIKQTSIVPVDPEEQTKIEFVGELREIVSNQENINLLILFFNFSSRLLILQGLFTWFFNIEINYLIVGSVSFAILQISRFYYLTQKILQMIQGLSTSAFSLVSIIFNNYSLDYSYVLIGSFITDILITIIFICYRSYQNQKN